ncbi:hypothetical protein JYK14_07800 [Siccirubricoccus sp. KC 17139]|uniref:Uncharacterized protein n=1 Tax=Siccirubricoccus soli TaxID=2899147 RepID=A0ABT1D2D1_9PROT|nr:hypothetical protein [Siccirubricoccus soli]MCO6416073.1 hypothetical protein [Siccirubricoccus soli]MCP2682205.1 hypothetical protein [Siccirubricoccus soli]
MDGHGAGGAAPRWEPVGFPVGWERRGEAGLADYLAWAEAPPGWRLSHGGRELAVAPDGAGRWSWTVRGEGVEVRGEETSWAAAMERAWAAC